MRSARGYGQAEQLRRSNTSASDASSRLPALVACREDYCRTLVHNLVAGEPNAPRKIHVVAVEVEYVGVEPTKILKDFSRSYGASRGCQLVSLVSRS